MDESKPPRDQSEEPVTQADLDIDARRAELTLERSHLVTRTMTPGRSREERAKDDALLAEAEERLRLFNLEHPTRQPDG
jgi:hypothetical protein